MNKYIIIVLAAGRIKFDLNELLDSNKDIHFIFITHTELITNHNNIRQLIFNPKIDTEETIISKVKDINNCTGVVSINEDGQILANSIRKHLNIEFNFGDITRFVNKDIMSKIAAESNLSYPRTVLLDANTMNFGEMIDVLNVQLKNSKQILCKPFNGTRSEDVYVLNNNSDVSDFIYAALQKKGIWLVQEYIKLTLFHYDFLISNGDLRWENIGEYAFPNHIAEEKGCLGSVFIHDYLEFAEFQDFKKALLNAFAPFPNGVFHCEFFWDYKNRKLPIFLEIAWRSPGAGLPEAYEYISKVNTQEVHVKSQWINDFSRKFESHKNYGAWMWLYRPVTAQVIDVINSFSSNYKLKLFDNINSTGKNRGVAAQLIMRNVDKTNLITDYQNILNVL